MSTTIALTALAAGTPFEITTIERRELRPNDVLIDIAYAGICHTDIHQARDDWSRATFPMVPGHEISGVVSAVGSGVVNYAVGDRVGVGCYVDSCGTCDGCQDGEEQYCENRPVSTYASVGYDGQPTYGGYSKQIVVREEFVVRIPDAIPLDRAAPLLCAGITMFSPLRRWKAGPGTRVAIVGLGGLGHMGVQLAHAMGAEVTVLSQSLSKKDDGLRLGADHYYATSDSDTFTTLQNTFDLILNTVSAPIDLDAFLSLLRRDGTLVHVGATLESQPIRTIGLIRARRSMAGSAVGGIRETQEMLDFCGEHELGAEVETIGADQVDDAYERVLASDVRYRFVIDIATLKQA